MRCGVGIDPGLSGALALVTEQDAGPMLVDVYDIPVHKHLIGGKVRMRVDVHQLCSLVAALAACGPVYAVQEEVWSRPIVRPGKNGAPQLIKPNAGSALQLGYAAGQSLMALAAHGIPFEEAPPSQWKGALGVSANKEEARAAASRLLPAGASLWPMKKHDGRAEAALLGLYALQLAKARL